MTGDDTVTCAQTKAGTFSYRLGGKEWMEHLVQAPLGGGFDCVVTPVLVKPEDGPEPYPPLF